MGKLKILVTGKHGQLGNALQELTENQSDISWKFTDRSELDITDSIKIQSVLKKFQPDWIINAAAYTDVDGAEGNQEIAYKVNAHGPFILADSAKEIGAKLVHISTDYVFDGTKKEPYTENDKPNPIQVYGKSKYEGEKKIRSTGVSGIIIRTSWLYGVHGNNFVKTILSLAEMKEEIYVVDDQFGSPTYVLDLAKTIIELISKKSLYQMDVLHYSNLGEISWYLFAKKIIEISKNKCIIKPISGSEYKQIAKRPNYTVLSHEKIANKIKDNLKDWVKSIHHFNNKYLS